MHIRSFIGGVRATGTLCFYSALSAARPLAGLKGPKVRVARCPVFDRTVRFLGDLSGQKYDAKPDN